jgi:hypothetical protein
MSCLAIVAPRCDSCVNHRQSGVALRAVRYLRQVREVYRAAPRMSEEGK